MGVSRAGILGTAVLALLSAAGPVGVLAAQAADRPVRDGALPDWANPAIVRRNVEPTHASFTAYPTEEAARTARPSRRST